MGLAALPALGAAVGLTAIGPMAGGFFATMQTAGMIGTPIVGSVMVGM